MEAVAIVKAHWDHPVGMEVKTQLKSTKSTSSYKNRNKTEAMDRTNSQEELIQTTHSGLQMV